MAEEQQQEEVVSQASAAPSGGQGMRPLTIILVAVLIALMFGGGGYWLGLKMAAKSEESTTAEETTTPSTSTTLENTSDETATATPTGEAAAKKFCEDQATQGKTVSEMVDYVSDANGEFVDCTISSATAPGAGGHIIAKQIDGNWSKIWEGNGCMKAETYDEHQVPEKIYSKKYLCGTSNQLEP